MIAENVRALLGELAGGNGKGEPVTPVAATKTRTPEEINEAIEAGIADVGENKVQEFTAKFDAVRGGRRHFIGHLQTNKVKYLVGKADLIQSLDRTELADELQKRAERAGWTANCLLEVNIGSELSKSGFSLAEAKQAYASLSAYPNLHLEGLMAMLPISEDVAYLGALCLSMREIYDTIRMKDADCRILSMGMSGDWKLCVECGSNMVRLGTAIFGARRAPAASA